MPGDEQWVPAEPVEQDDSMGFIPLLLAGYGVYRLFGDLWGLLFGRRPVHD